MIRLLTKQTAFFPCLVVVVGAAFWKVRDVAASADAFPSFAQVRSVVESHFHAKQDFQQQDLITAGDVAPIFRELEQLGWKDVARCDAAKQLLDDQSVLARELRSPPGRKFMRRVASYKLIYDRLDRISRMTGGQPLIHDLVRLPDGHRYAQWTPHRGAPSMEEFLPKGVSGKSPRVPDLDQPTGRIYTVSELLTRLEVCYRQAQPASP
jgi:hypothetical protein